MNSDIKLTLFSFSRGALKNKKILSEEKDRNSGSTLPVLRKEFIVRIFLNHKIHNLIQFRIKPVNNQ